MTSSDSPQVSATKGQIDAVDPTLATIYTQQLGPSDLTPGNHSVILTMPSRDLDPEKFLISATDGDAAKDKAGRSRYALQHNNRAWAKPDKTIAFCWGGGLGKAVLTGATKSATDFIAAMGTLGYKRLPGYTYGTFGDGDSAYDWWYGDPNANDIAGRWDNTKPLSSSNKRTGALNVDWNDSHILSQNSKLLKTVFFGGHGSPDGAVLELRGADVASGTYPPAPVGSTQTFLVATQAYFDMKDTSGNPLYPYLRNAQTPTKSIVIDTDVYPAVSGSSPLGNLDLVILSGCSQSLSTPGVVSLGQAFSNAGAKCVLTVGDSFQVSTIASSFIKSFLGKLNSMTLNTAFTATQKEFDRFNDEGHYAVNDQSETVKASIIMPGTDFQLATH